MTPRDRTSRQRGRIASQVVGALIAGRGTRPEDVYLPAGLSRSTFYNRMTKGNWELDELADIAAILNEPIGSFFDGLGGRFTGGDDGHNSQRSSRDTRQLVHAA